MSCMIWCSIRIQKCSSVNQENIPDLWVRIGDALVVARISSISYFNFSVLRAKSFFCSIWDTKYSKPVTSHHNWTKIILKIPNDWSSKIIFSIHEIINLTIDQLWFTIVFRIQTVAGMSHDAAWYLKLQHKVRMHISRHRAIRIANNRGFEWIQLHCSIWDTKV